MYLNGWGFLRNWATVGLCRILHRNKPRNPNGSSVTALPQTMLTEQSVRCILGNLYLHHFSSFQYCFLDFHFFSIVTVFVLTIIWNILYTAEKCMIVSSETKHYKTVMRKVITWDSVNLQDRARINHARTYIQNK